MLNINNTLDGFLKDVEIKGNTVQDINQTGDLADIRSVGDKVEGQELYKIPVLSCGKNLFRMGKDNEVHRLNYNSIIEIKDNGFILTDTKVGDVGGFVIKCKPNTTYSITYNDISTNKSSKFLRTFSQYPTDTNSNINIENSSTNGTYISVTTSNECKYLVFGVYGGNDTKIIQNIQLEEGTQATPYEPYQEDKLTILSPVQLEKVGDVRDRIICKDGVWGVEKNIDTIQFGELNVVSANIITDEYYGCYFIYEPLLNTTISKIITNLPKQTWLESLATSPTYTYWQNGKTSSGIILPKSMLSEYTTAAFKEKLTELGLFAKLPITNPTFIPLPHDQQIKLRTFAGQTNIHFETEIEGTIKAQVPKSIGATVNTHTEQIANLNKELDRVKKLEESTVSTVTTESDFTTVEETSNGYFEDVKLEGKTLVNLIPTSLSFVVNSGMAFTSSNLTNLNPASIYTFIIIDNNSNKLFNRAYLSDVTGVKEGTITLHKCAEVGTGHPHLYTKDGSNIPDGYMDNVKVIILEGDHTQNPPEYFEGLMSVGQDVDEISVESVNENLFNKTQLGANGTYITNTGSVGTDGDLERRATDFIKVKPNTSYIFYGVANSGITNSGRQVYVREYDINKTTRTSHILDVTSDVMTIRTGSGTHYIRTTVRTPDIDRYMIKVGDTVSNYAPHQSNKKPLLYYNPTTQTWEKPILRQWDSIEKHSDGKYYYHKRSREVVLNGSEDGIVLLGDNTNSTLGFGINKSNFPNIKKISVYPNENKVFNDRFNYLGGTLWDIDSVGMALNAEDDTKMFQIKLLKTSLPTQDVQGFKQWLQANNVTVVYQLAEEKVYECTNIDLITYENETNYIVSSGAITPKSTLRVHSNISNVVKILQEKVNLLESNVIASQEVQDMMILETDMRMLDIELALMEFMPMELNLGGSNMLRSATYFNFLKNHIINETYEKEYLENVMNKYLATGRINQDEYDELYKMLYPPVYDIALPIEY